MRDLLTIITLLENNTNAFSFKQADHPSGFSIRLIPDEDVSFIVVEEYYEQERTKLLKIEVTLDNEMISAYKHSREISPEDALIELNDYLDQFNV